MTSSPMTRTQDGAARTAVEVRMEGLSRRYGPVVALDRLDLTLQPGELVVLLGPSGCGKTTTLRLLAGLEDADTGQIFVGGKDITRVPASQARHGDGVPGLLAVPAHDGAAERGLRAAAAPGRRGAAG